MQANTANMGQAFYKLVQAKHSDLRDDITDYDGDDTSLLEHYVIATDEDDCDYVSCEAAELGTVTLVQVDTVTVVGSCNFETRCYTDKVAAYKDANGSIWMDAELHDDVFC
jgi:hypothetical protein